jgi:hypothetical protein
MNETYPQQPPTQNPFAAIYSDQTSIQQHIMLTVTNGLGYQSNALDAIFEQVSSYYPYEVHLCCLDILTAKYSAVQAMKELLDSTGIVLKRNQQRTADLTYNLQELRRTNYSRNYK